MALYRNISGIDNRMGLSILEPTFIKFPGTPISTLPNAFDPAEIMAQKEAIRRNLEEQNTTNYDYLLSIPYTQIVAEGYYITPDTFSIFKWADSSHTTSRVFLALQDIQNIENARGTAGALFMHMQEPAIAKNTAGYVGGGYYTFSRTPPTYQPIQAVQDLPPVVLDETGNPVLEYTGPSTLNPTPTTTTDTTAIPTTTTTTPTAAAKSNLGPLVALGGLVAIALAGDTITGRRTNLLFAGGVGAFFYFMAKRSK